MNNATDALKIAAAVLVFTVAISLLFSLMTAVKSTADTVLFYSDQTNFYEWDNGDDSERIVGEDTVISALYSQKEGLSYVYIIDGTSQIYPNASYNNNIPELIQNELNTGATYIEKVIEVTVSGEHIFLEDGTTISPKPGDSRTHIYYIKQ